MKPTTHFLGRLSVPVLAICGLLLLGAKDEGCEGSIYIPPQSTIDAAALGDGMADGGTFTSSAWPAPPTPTPGPPSPMTCAWLASDNCWKRIAREIARCEPAQDTSAILSKERTSCSYASGARIELGGPLNDPPSDIVVTDQRVLDANGAPCFTGKIVGLGKVTISSPTETALFESTSLLKYQLTCPDGTTFTNDGEGVCPSFGLDYLAGKTPGSSFGCTDGGDCSIQLSGTDSGRQLVARCRDGAVDVDAAE